LGTESHFLQQAVRMQSNASLFFLGWPPGLCWLMLLTMLISTRGITKEDEDDAEEAGTECCPKNFGPECNLPECPSGQYCAWAGEEIGPPVCRPIPELPKCDPALTPELVTNKLKGAGFKSGQLLKDPYECTPQPCGDLPQLGPVTAMPEPQKHQDGSITQRFLFRSFKGNFKGGQLPDGRPWWRVENSLETTIRNALGGETAAAVAIASGDGKESGVEITATISAPGEDTCKKD